MSKLLMDYKSIRDSINLKEDYWNNIKTTNCYAFALGLDIPSGKLMSFGIESPYGVGNIGRFKFGYDYFDIYGLTFEERFFMDLDALGIQHREANQYEKMDSKNNNLNWLIAMYRDTKTPDFHFLRKRSDNFWTHKLGRDGDISIVDSTGRLITNLDNAKFHYVHKYETVDYEFKGVYKLTLKR